MAQAYHRTYGMPTLITRSSNNYGPRQYPEKLIPLTIKKALAGEPIPVYGDLPIESTAKFTEDSPLHPNSPYSVAKAAGDMMAQAYHRTYGLPTLITRSSNNYGPRQYPEKLIPLTIKKALAGEPIPVYGDGLNVRDWLYVEDNCHAIDAVLRNGTPGQVYNIGAGNEMSNIDLIHLLLHALGQQTGRPEENYTKLITFVPDRPGHDRRYAVDSAKAHSMLDWSTQNSFDRQVQRCLAW